MRNSFVDLLIPIAVLSVVAMMVFPLPGVLLDMLLMFNITFSLVLLISAVYLEEPEKFTSLPTILLLTTLFRLGLNISTTREILGSANAPEVVKAFGDFVTSGNLIVGGVIFIIVTIIQFLVIAKGAERVAEVAARFTLDAMPGKQMSIDADVRAGAISTLEAKEKRFELQKEAKLYGALDGAMKFVKGDSIAGLLITVVNISAGFIVGISQMGMSASEAMQRFTIFTIGDGLVSQVPALLIAVAAGIVVTRVSDKSDSFMGQEMFSQLTKEPRTIIISGISLMGLGLVPGLPTLMFVLFGVFMLLLGLSLTKESEEEELTQVQNEFKPMASSPLLLKLSPKIGMVLHKEGILPSLLQQARRDIFKKRGVLVPDFQFEIDNETEDEYLASLVLNGVRIRKITLERNQNNSESKRISDIIIKEINSKLHNLINDTQTRSLLEVHSPISEDLVNSVIPDLITVTELTVILRRLVKEAVSIHELGVILQAVSEFKTLHNNVDSKNTSYILEAVRVKLGGVICEKLINEDTQVLEVYTINKELESLLTEASIHSVPLSPLVCESIKEAFLRAFNLKKEVGKATILTSSTSRALLYDIVSSMDFNLSVISSSEVVDGIRIRVIKQIEVEFLENGEKEHREVESENNVIDFKRAKAI